MRHRPAGRAVQEGVDEERGVVGAEANINRQWNLGGITDVCDFLGSPIAPLVFEDEPQL